MGAINDGHTLHLYSIEKNICRWSRTMCSDKKQKVFLSIEKKHFSAEGGIFTFSVVCNDRLSQLVAHKNNDDATFWSLTNADLFLVS